MARELKAKIKIEADTKKAESSFKKLDKSIDQTSKSSSKLGSSFGSVLGKLTALVGGVTLLTKAFTFAFTAARDQEIAVAKLDAALIPLGASANAVSEALQRQAGELQALTGVSDTEVLASQALVAQFTRDQAAIESLTVRAIDLSRGLGIDLRSATLLIAKTFGSATNALVEYGFTVEGAAGSSDRLNSILAATSDVAGQAAAQIENFTGQLDLLQGNLGDSAENVVELITKDETLIETLKRVNKELADFNTTVDESPTFLGKLGLQVSGATIVLGDFLSRLDPVNRLLIQFQDAADDASKDANKLGSAIEDTTKAQRSFNAIFLEATEFLNAYGEALSDDEQKQRDLANSIDGVKDRLRELGVILEEDTNKALKNNEDLLARSNILYRLGEIDRRELEAAERLVADSISKSRFELLLQSGALQESEDSTLTFAEALRIAKAELDALTFAEGRNADAVEEAARRRIAARDTESLFTPNVTGGESTFVTFSGGQFSIPNPVVTRPNGRVEPAFVRVP